MADRAEIDVDGYWAEPSAIVTEEGIIKDGVVVSVTGQDREGVWRDLKFFLPQSALIPFAALITSHILKIEEANP